MKDDKTRNNLIIITVLAGIAVLSLVSYLTYCIINFKNNYSNNDTNDKQVVTCTLNKKYNDYRDSLDNLNVDINDENSLIAVIRDRTTKSDGCNQISISLSDIKVILQISYLKEGTLEYFTLDKISYNNSSVVIDNNLEFLQLIEKDNNIIINETGPSSLIGNAIVIKDGIFYDLSNIDYVSYENNQFNYLLYNKDYTDLLVSKCDANEIKEADMSKTFEEKGIIVFNGNEYTLNKTKTITVSDQCKIMEEEISE